MNQEIEIDKNQHAYLISGEREDAVFALKRAVEKIFGIKLSGNPDYRESYFEVLGIDESRQLKEEQSRKAFSGKEKFFIIVAGSITREAQNALLKVFEEPTEGTYLFLVVPSTRQILPTLLSRVRIIQVASRKSKVESFGEAKEFLVSPVEKRLNMALIKKLTEDKDRQSVISFLNAVETAVHEKFPVGKIEMPTQEFLHELIKYRGYAGDRSSSVKMLLEQVALTAPQITE